MRWALLLLLAGCRMSDAPPELVVQNALDVPLIAVELRPCGATAWGDNRLSAPILPASRATVSLHTGCFDIAARPDERTRYINDATEFETGHVYLFMVREP